MKKNKTLRFLTVLAVLFLSFSCDDEDNVVLEAPSSIAAEAGYGEVIFTWDFPSDEQVEFVRVDYVDAEGNAKHQKFSEYTEMAIIAGLEEKPYEFVVTASDKGGNLSEPTVLTVTPNKPPYLFVAETVMLEPDFGSIILTWENITGKQVGINVKYMDENGQEQIFVANSADEQGMAVLSGLTDDEQNFEVYVTSQSGSKSASQFFELAPYLQVKFDKSSWEIVDFSSEEAGGEGPVNGYATAAIDGDINTFWHSTWSTASPVYPHWITVDMKDTKIVSRVVLFTRQKNGGGMTKFRIEGSLDNTTWETVGEYDFNRTNFDGQEYRLTSNPQMRYLRMTALEGANTFTFLGELDVYGQ